MDIPRDLFLGGVGAAIASATAGPKSTGAPKKASANKLTGPEIGDAWYTHHDPDKDDARKGQMFFQSWTQLKPFGDRFVMAFMTDPALRIDYYSHSRSWFESTQGKQFGEKWCTLIEDRLPELKGKLRQDDFASFHKYLFWTLATAVYQQTRVAIHTFPPKDDLAPARPSSFLTFHGVPNGGGGGGLQPGGAGFPPP
jgi:hypothetical protein